MAIRKVNPTDAARRARAVAADVDGRHPATSRRIGTEYAMDKEEGYGFTPENRALILKRIQDGNPPSTAMGSVLIAQHIQAWVARARKGDRDMIEFFEQARLAEKNALVRWSGILEAAARGDTLKIPTGEKNPDGTDRVREIVPDAKTLQFLLERRDPKHFGKTSKLEHSGPNGVPLATAPFQFDRNFKDWTKEEILEFATTGRPPTRIAALPTPHAEAKSVEQELEAFLASA